MSDGSKDKHVLPRAKDVLAGVTVGTKPAETSRPERKFLQSFSREAVEQQVRYAHLIGIRDHYAHKGRWSWFLMLSIGSMLAFQSYLLFKVGTSQWDFSSYDWLLPALLVQNLAQVVGLSVWAVKYLFSDISKQAPE